MPFLRELTVNNRRKLTGQLDKVMGPFIIVMVLNFVMVQVKVMVQVEIMMAQFKDPACYVGSLDCAFF